MATCPTCGAVGGGATCAVCGTSLSPAEHPTAPDQGSPWPDETQRGPYETYDWSAVPAEPPRQDPGAFPPPHDPGAFPPPRERGGAGKVALVVVGLAAAVALGFFGSRLFGQPDEPAPTAVTAAPTNSAASSRPPQTTPSWASPSAGGSSATRATTTSGTPSGPVPATTLGGGPDEPPPSTASGEATARQALAATYAADRATFSTDGRWLIQLSSKWVGIVDSQQVTTSGSHTFGAQDIFAEYRQLKNRYGAVRLLQSTDFAKQYVYAKKPAGEPIWVSAYDPGWMRSESEAMAWCQREFPGRSGDDLKNVCFPRQARPPYTE